MTAGEQIRLMIAEDQTVIRKALSALLALEKDMAIVAAVGDGEQAVSAALAYAPDVILMDLKMPRMDGIAATRAILSKAPDIRIVMLTTFDADDLVFEAVMAGAQGYLLKDAEESEILSAIRSAARGEPHLSPRVAAKILSEFRRVKASSTQMREEKEEPLTERERDVLNRVAAGKGNREIAREMGLAEGTVKNHVSTILAKLHLRSRTELAIRALSAR
ncbi:MAG TPA: response regulator transcription factor [Methylocystis sp.]